MESHLVLVSKLGMFAVRRAAPSELDSPASDVPDAPTVVLLVVEGVRFIPSVSRITCWSALRIPLSVIIACQRIEHKCSYFLCRPAVKYHKFNKEHVKMINRTLSLMQTTLD